MKQSTTHHKVYDWAILLQSLRSHHQLQVTLLTKSCNIQKSYLPLSSRTDTIQSIKPASLLHVLLHMRSEGFIHIHGVSESHPFLSIQHNLDRFSRFAFWAESLILSMNSGDDNHAFIFMQSLLHWLNIKSIPPVHLDSVFLYYFLLINGSLPETLHILPSFAHLNSLSITDLQQYLRILADNRQLYHSLSHLYQEYMPMMPKSFHQLRIYDSLA
ncbi:hypothetical protein PVA45_06925 [Entomospira entomophila]|uniref:Uncharacterized protein n=1 Tax=Entomospira entomophila TaxID=2719988 RepID=A0A968KRZ9_9SPIO|nr:hypothetical protein [Entomospira entomophilus]NIZ41234.1 hypothetical protein [Entomospira entomophilus]WDI35439.1 hypothetical protein PVA45_06925 [Entomospira entomophilus]